MSVVISVCQLLTTRWAFSLILRIQHSFIQYFKLEKTLSLLTFLSGIVLEVYDLPAGDTPIYLSPGLLFIALCILHCPAAVMECAADCTRHCVQTPLVSYRAGVSRFSFFFFFEWLLRQCPRSGAFCALCLRL